jgi:hypothetical protein
MINFYVPEHARSSASATDIGLNNYPDWLEPVEPEWVMGATSDFEKFATAGNRLPILGFRVPKVRNGRKFEYALPALSRDTQ